MHVLARLMEAELEIDPETGMKNYIANSGKGWDTSARYIQDQLRMCVDKGRRGQSDRRLMMDALIHLGGALHTLEDFAAHSNFVELCLNKLGEEDVFAVVGDGCRVQVPSTNQQVPPLVTGTFGMLDVYQSILGEADDKATLSCGSALGELGELSNVRVVELSNVSFKIVDADCIRTSILEKRPSMLCTTWSSPQFRCSVRSPI